MKAEQTVERDFSSVQPGEHLCCFCGDGQPLAEIRLRFLADGLALGQRVLYLYHDEDPAALAAGLAEALERAGHPAQAALARGQLLLAPAAPFFTAPVALPDASATGAPATHARLLEAEQAALQAGYPALRAAVDMGWALALEPGSAASEHLARCESLFSAPGALPATLLLCLYDRSGADPAFLLDVLAAHPLVLETNVVYANPCCLPSGLFFSAQRGAALFDLHLQAITHGHRNDALASAHAALHERETRYHTIFNAATDFIFIHDLQGTFLEVNRMACERFGYAAHELLGQHTDFLDVPELAGQGAVRLSLLRACGAITYETVHRTRAGELVPVEVSARLIDYAGRQVVLSIARDITERKHAELCIVNANQALAETNETLERTNQALEASNAALRESEQKFRSLIESSPNGISLIDERGRILEFNPANESIYGIPAGRALGMLASDFHQQTLPPERLQPETMDAVRASMAAALRDGQAEWLYQGIEREILAFDGRRRFVQSTGFPIRTERGYMIGMITRDVTAHRQAERELEDYRQRLEVMVAERTAQLLHEVRERQQAEQNLEVMLREIHHRVKNNLNVMIALIDLQKSAHADPAVQETFKELQSRAHTMALVHESLYRSPNLAQVELDSYLQTLSDFLQYAYSPGDGSQAVQLDVQAESVTMPIETAIPCGLIVNELVTNALKYAFPPERNGREAHRVQVRLERGATGDGRIILTVADNGAGLPSGFEWQRATTLGLQLVRVLARQLGGQIALQPGPGTVWRLEFNERR